MRSKLSKIFFFISLLLILLACVACNGECRHKEMSEDIVLPSCGERGYTVFTCLECSFSFESDFVAPTPHTLTSVEIASTCTSGGYTLNECSNCDYSYISDPIAIIDHTIASTVVPPTCTEGGYTLHECSACGYTTTSDPLSPLPHEYKKTVTEPTCAKEGFTTYSCERCKHSYTADHLSALAHVFNVQTVSPTCLEEGYTQKSCSVCGTVIITDYTNPTGHSYVDKKIRATSSRDGYTLHDCNKCDYSYNSNYEYSYAIFTGAYADSNKPLAKGIDVSSYNGTLDWNKLAAQGIEFAIIRAGSSKSGEDLFFSINYSGARSAGIDVGVYYYVEATSVEEMLGYADNLKKILGTKKFEYPIYLDFEKDELGKTLGKELVTKMCSAFIEKLQSDGYFAALYTNNNWLENYYVRDTVTDLYDVWYARYISQDALASPEWNLQKYGTTMGVWQYTDEGTIDGFENNFDINLAYKDYPTIIKRYHYNGY